MVDRDGRYRLTAYGSNGRYIGVLICNDHEHPTFEEAQECILVSLQTGRPAVLPKADHGTMIVLVCGGRDYQDSRTVFAILDNLAQVFRIEAIIHGEASGADRLAKRWAVHRGVPERGYPAAWERDGKAAGATRNRLMYDREKPDLVVAFPTAASRGTWDMVRVARDGGTKVIVVPDDLLLPAWVLAIAEGVHV